MTDTPTTGQSLINPCLIKPRRLPSVTSIFAIQYTQKSFEKASGVEIFDQATGAFVFRKGPVFAHIVLGDEINRASPKTQSALLQVMAEREVTAGRETHPIPEPFFCVATQNPVDHQGTYMLPEAQLDRFLMRISIGYPLREDEKVVVAQGIEGLRPDGRGHVLSIADVVAMASTTRDVKIADVLMDYLVEVAALTRENPAVRLGVSPRGTIALARAAQVRAASLGRHYATPDDVKDVAKPVLSHRLLLTPEALMRGKKPEDIVQEAVDEAKIPRKP